MTTRILVVTAHPDDELLGPGPMLFGMSPYVLCFCENSSRHGDDKVTSLRSVEQSVCGGLGGILTALGLGDQRLDSYSFTKLVGHVESALAEVHPTLVLTHSGTDLNRDHRLLSEIVGVATRRFNGTVAEFSGVSYDDGFGGQFIPNWRVSVPEQHVLMTGTLFEDVYPAEKSLERSAKTIHAHFGWERSPTGYAVCLKQTHRCGL